MSILSTNQLTGRTGRITVANRIDLAQSKGLLLPRWTGSQRPTSPEIGFMGFNTTDSVWECWTGSQWLAVDGTASGGLAITSGLILRLDASDTASYPGSGSTWTDLSRNNNNFTVNPSAFQSSEKYFDFKGSYGCAKNGGDISLSGDVTYVAVTRVKNSTSEWRTLTRSYSSDHHVIIESGGWNIGMYDNDGVGFIGTGYSQQSLPGYNSNTFDVMCWRWTNNDNPTYDLNVNGSQRGTFTNSNGRYNRGFGSIGAYHNGNSSDVNNASQYWGDIKLFAVYNRRLSDTEVSSNYTSLKSKFQTN